MCMADFPECKRQKANQYLVEPRGHGSVDEHLQAPPSQADLVNSNELLRATIEVLEERVQKLEQDKRTLRAPAISTAGRSMTEWGRL